MKRTRPRTSAPVVPIHDIADARRRRLAAENDRAEDKFCTLCTPYGLEQALADQNPEDDIAPLLKRILPRMPVDTALYVIDLVEGILQRNDELRRLEKRRAAR